MLTELRDINKRGSRLSLVYYVVSCAIPAIVVALTLGLKQEVYTNLFSLNDLYAGSVESFFSSSLYCWLCVTNRYEIFYVLLLPIGVVVFLVLFFGVLCFVESKRNSFKETEVPVVRHNLVSSALVLVVQCCITFFLSMFVYTSSLPNASSASPHLTTYQYLYLGAALLHSVVILLSFVLFNKHTKSQLISSWTLLVAKSPPLDHSLDASNLGIYAKTPCFKLLLASTKNKMREPLNSDPSNHILKNKVATNKEIFKVNSRFVLDYRDLNAHHANSGSTTTTNGTVDEIDYPDPYLKQNYLMSHPGYLSHLANTTNTESTVNDSELLSNYDFNRAPLPSNSEVSDSDVIDVGKILKSRQFINDSGGKNVVYSESPNKHHHHHHHQTDTNKMYNSGNF